MSQDGRNPKLEILPNINQKFTSLDIINTNNNNNNNNHLINHRPMASSLHSPKQNFLERCLPLLKVWQVLTPKDSSFQVVPLCSKLKISGRNRWNLQNFPLFLLEEAHGSLLLNSLYCLSCVLHNEMV